MQCIPEVAVPGAAATASLPCTNTFWGRKRGIRDLVEKISSNLTSPKSLHILSSRTFNDESAVALCDALANNNVLTELFASGHTLGPAGFAAFSRLLSNGSALQYLSIGSSRMGSEGLSVLSEGIASNNALRVLNLELKGIAVTAGNSAGLDALCQALVENSSLHELIISRNSLGNIGACMLADMVRKKCSVGNLQVLTMSEVALGMDGMIMLGKALVDGSVIFLDVSYNPNIGPNGISGFVAAGGINALKTLVSNGCNIGDEGICMLARALRNGRSSMEVLKVRDNSISPNGAFELAQALAPMSVLTHLDLGGNAVGPHAAALFVNVGGLRHLGLLGNRLGNEGLIAIAKCVHDNPSSVTIKYLDICGNQIGDDGIIHFCSTLQELESDDSDDLPFDTVIVGSNPIKDAGNDAIEALLIATGNSRKFLRDPPRQPGEEPLEGACHETAPPMSEKQPFSFYLSPHESSRVKIAVEDNFSSILRSNSGQVDSDQPLPDFVWIHTPTHGNEQLRMECPVVSQLSGIDVLENKGNLSLLSTEIDAPMLQSVVIAGAQFRLWCSHHFSDGSADHEQWIAKDSAANGGDGLFPFHSKNWQTVATNLGETAEYVLQQYIDRPLLWAGLYKFHFRVYCILTADMEVYCYRQAFAHVCNKPYVTSASISDGLGDSYFDREVHISNVAANVHNEDHFHNYPVVDLPSHYPRLWKKMGHTLASVVKAAEPFMKYQRSKDNFMLIGADFLPDDEGNIWLLELNCPPCMAAYQGNDEQVLKVNKFEQAIRPLVSAVVRDLVNDFVLPPLWRRKYGNDYDAERCTWTHATSGNYVRATQLEDTHVSSQQRGALLALDNADLAKNGLSWKVFKWRKSKSKKW